MLKLERPQKIVAYIKEHGASTVDDLSAVTHASLATIRRDLTQLAQEKAILRTHGGAVIYHQPAAEDLPLDVRRQMHQEEKERVAEAAVHLIREGSTIYIGAGTTGNALASKLGCFHHLTVLTNDIDVAHEISYTDNVLIMTGGQLKPHSQTLYGFFAELTLRDLNVDTAFMIVDAVDLDNGFMDYNVDEVSLKRLVIQNAKQCIMLCDAAKFQISALVNVCRLNDVQTVVTNAEADPVYLQRLQNAGIKVVCADKKANEGESL